MIEALAAAVGRDVSRETFEQLDHFEALLREENERQNLVSRGTLEHFWLRHVIDSAQLVRFAPRIDSSWVDIGSGGGLPGIVIALLTTGPVMLIEPRRLRAEFLKRATHELGMSNRVSVFQGKAEQVCKSFEVITARAVASLSNLLDLSFHLSTGKTLWVVPKGRGAKYELAEAQRQWHGTFHVERSITDAESFVVIASGVRAKAKR